MSSKILKNIIENFSIEEFQNFFRIKSNKFIPDGSDLPLDGFENYFSEGKKIGEINFDFESIIIASFKSTFKLSERSGKKRQYELAKKILKQQQKYDAGIFIFYDEDGNFRMSLVHEIPLKKRRKFNNFKRFTYFVEKGQPYYTFLKQIGECNFSNLDEIKEAFSIEPLTKDFYQELSNWYFWALKNVKFPEGAETQTGGRNVALIRFITRLMFVWFLKRRELILDKLFNKNELKEILKDFNPYGSESNYYKAILQNLFFATLSCKQKERRFADDPKWFGKGKGGSKDYGNQYTYRYKELFKISEREGIKLFEDIPFLNGGIFEMLDDKENKENKIYIDGFTRIKKFQPVFPNFLFFSDEKVVDLSEDYGQSKYRKAKVRGILNIFNSYNFTIDESSPVDVEIALDPEMLGKVFENLLASYNPETATTARKATGSYYTPREIVDYMVEESLKEYFKTRIPDINEKKLDLLFSFENEENPFDENTTDKLIDAIHNLKVIDPAVGSGAFPMGILHKLVHILHKLDPHNEKWKQKQIEVAEKIPDPEAKQSAIKAIEEKFREKELDYGRKLYLIRNCLFGVDIQPIAIQICKLRFFISLLVDEKIDKNKPNYGIEPLPNLETKFIAANTLIELGKELYQFPRMEEVYKLEKDLFKIRKKHFSAFTPEEKEQIREEDKKIRERILFIINDYINEKKKEKNKLEEEIKKIPSTPRYEEERDLLGNVKKIDINKKNREQLLIQKEKIERDIKQIELNLLNKFRKIAKFDIYNTNIFADWFDPEWMFGIRDGFDIVIANPPYIKEYTNKSAFDEVRNSQYYKGKMDIWYLFTCIGIDLLKENGILTFIAQNNWVTNYGASKMRNKVITETKILQLIDFGPYFVFGSSDIQTMIMIFKKQKINEDKEYQFEFRRIIDKNSTYKDVLDMLNKTYNPKIEYLFPTILPKEYKNKTLTFAKSTIENILIKIEKEGNFKLKENEITNGIHTHYDCITKEINKKHGGIFKIGQGIFVLTKEEVKNLNLTPKELGILKPYYTSQQLFKYYGDSRNKLWIIYTNSRFKNPYMMNSYPNLKKHLDQFKDVITSDNRPYGLHRARDEKFFKGEKIISLRKCHKEPIFTYTDFDCYVSAAFYVIKTSRINIKYLTGLLNSKLISFWLRYKGKMQGNNYQIDKEPLLTLPIKKLFEKNLYYQKLITFVEQILEIIKSSNNYLKDIQAQSKVKEIEKEINGVVYKIYNLTEEEIKIIEEIQ